MCISVIWNKLIERFDLASKFVFSLYTVIYNSDVFKIPVNIHSWMGPLRNHASVDLVDGGGPWRGSIFCTFPGSRASFREDFKI